jgi:predicted GNAT family N-acyltransferase
MGEHMNLSIKKLDKEYINLLYNFCCTETKESLLHYNAKTRKRIIRHSKEMEDFIQAEALAEQEKRLNITYLFIDSDENKLAAYISLCTDSIRLEIQEQNNLGLTYATIPAIKIARLAVANEYKEQGLGKSLIQFSAYIGNEIRKICGLVFITLDCYEHRISFYESIGFIKNLVQPINLPYDSPISMRLVLETYLNTIGNNNVFD